MSRNWQSVQPAEPVRDEEAEALVRTRALTGLWICLASNVSFIVADLATQPPNLSLHLRLKVAQTVVYVPLIILLGCTRLRRHGRAFIFGALAMGALGFLPASLARGEAATGPVLLITGTLTAGFMMPWGAGWQAPYALLATVVSWTLVFVVEGGTRAAIYPAVGRTVLFGASIIVAHVSERHRRERRRMEAALRESARSLSAANAELAEESRANATLLHVSASLQRHLRDADMLERVNALAVDALGCDWSSTFLWDDRRGGLALHASVGARPEVTAELGALVFPAPATDRDVFESTRTSDGLMRRFGNASCLCTPVRQGTEVRALLVHGFRERTAGFSARQHRLAVGIARATALALENARLIADLERASALKSEFVATMSHELRTPLNIVVGYGDMLLEGACGPLAPAGVDAVQRIRQRTLELLELINATLDLNRLDAGRVTVDVRPVALGPLLAEVHRELGPLAADGVACRLGCEPPGAVVVTDRAKLKTILRNLVGNALKFTPAGEVTVALAAEATRLEVVVRDTGVGIAADHLPIIFDMFRQVDGSTTRRFGGVGLGLHIVKRLTALMGGEVGVESSPGAGSTFRVSLPLAAAVERATA
jgi:signal transduction histidine kinase